ncbi:MAG: putative prophage phiRv2 integrase [Candidatus Aminicenantes bacterium ADurb.Bin147]|nr:MAG: putative prophage phiRv2 integrase [Candidatus Aminicenantes bacterium ADurb.Bin147]
MKREKNLVFVPANKDKPAHYLTEITLNYRRVRRFAGFTKEEARAKLAELRIAAKQGKLEETIKPEQPKDLFGEYARAVLDSAEWKSKRSAGRNEISLQHLNNDFKNSRLIDIKPGAVRRYVTRRIQEDGASPATVNRELSFLKSILYAAEADEIIPANPIRGRRVKKQPENNHREKAILGLNLTDDKIRDMVDAAAEYLKPILKIALTTGMRRDEILEMKWRDVDLQLGTVRIPAENAKSKRERTVPIDPDMCVDLDSMPRKGEYIFLNPETGQRIKDVRGSFAAACKAADIKTGRPDGLVFHDLRHLAAYHLVKVTDIVTASKILGHASLDMTLRYVHPTDTDKYEAVRKVAENLFRGRQKDVNAKNLTSSEGLENRILLH